MQYKYIQPYMTTYKHALEIDAEAAGFGKLATEITQLSAYLRHALGPHFSADAMHNLHAKR